MDHTFLHVLAEQLLEETEDVRRWTDGLTSVHDCVGLSVSAVTTEVEGKRMNGRTDKRP